MNKEWVEINFVCAHEAKELLSSFCFDLGSCGLVENDESLQVYFNSSDFNTGLKTSIINYLKNLRTLGFTVQHPVYKTIKNRDWNTGWKDFFKPVKAGKSIVVKPPWEKWNGPEPVVIDIYPRMAFGTGTHETTKLCLKFLEEIIEPECEVLDIGCGSGILSIAAVKLGAKSSLGIDVDPEAINNSIENSSINNVESYTKFIQADIEHITKNQYDIILVNILTHVLKTIIPSLRFFCKKKTKIVLTGILVEEEAGFKSFCRNHGIDILDQKTEGEWLALLACCGCR